MKQLESLDVWRGAQELAYDAYRLTMGTPLERHVALADQIRGAAISIPANIAEGYALGSSAQFIRHLRISLGSTSELRIHLAFARRLGLVPETEALDAVKLSDRVISMLVGLLRKLASTSHSRFPFPASRFSLKRPRSTPPS